MVRDEIAMQNWGNVELKCIRYCFFFYFDQGAPTEKLCWGCFCGNKGKTSKPYKSLPQEKKNKQNTNSEQKTGNMIRLCICIKRKISNTKSLEDTLFVKEMMLQSLILTTREREVGEGGGKGEGKEMIEFLILDSKPTLLPLLSFYLTPNNYYQFNFFFFHFPSLKFIHLSFSPSFDFSMKTSQLLNKK